MALVTPRKTTRVSRAVRLAPRRAGRPKLNKLRRQVKLLPEIDSYLRDLGNGELSMGIERAARLAQNTAQVQSSDDDARLNWLQERGLLSQRATSVPKTSALLPYKANGKPISQMLAQERR